MFEVLLKKLVITKKHLKPRVFFLCLCCTEEETVVLTHNMYRSFCYSRIGMAGCFVCESSNTCLTSASRTRVIDNDNLSRAVSR